MQGIDRARIFIPYSIDYNLKNRSYGRTRFLGGDEIMYEMYKYLGANSDDYNKYENFYKILSLTYNMDLSKLPAVRPYISYVDYVKEYKGTNIEKDNLAIENLKRNNVLIIKDSEEREFIEHVHFNFIGENLGVRKFEYKKQIPQRFLTLKDKEIVNIMRQMAVVSYSR